jgi:hypothetical protein
VYFHHVAWFETHPIAEAQRAGAKEVDVDIARPAVHGELEVMMLHVFE